MTRERGSVNPEYCPCDNEKLEEGVVCKGLGYTYYEKGSGSFCIGKTQLHKSKCCGHEHVNGYLICIRYGKVDNEENIHTGRTCKKDMEMLHDILHKAVGFMHHEIDEDAGVWHPNTQALLDVYAKGGEWRCVNGELKPK